MFYHTVSRRILKMFWWWPLHSLGFLIFFMMYSYHELSESRSNRVRLSCTNTAFNRHEKCHWRNLRWKQDYQFSIDCQALNKIKSSLKTIWFKLTLKSLLGKGLKKCTRCIALCTSCIALCTSCIALCTICIRRQKG